MALKSICMSAIFFLIFLSMTSAANADETFKDLCQGIDQGGQGLSSPPISNTGPLELDVQHVPTDPTGIYDSYVAKVDEHCKIVTLKSDLRVPAPQKMMIVDKDASFSPLYRNCDGNFITKFYTQSFALRRKGADIAVVSVQCDLNAQTSNEEAALKAFGLAVKFDSAPASSPAEQHVEVPVPSNRGISSVIEDSQELKTLGQQRSCPVTPSPVCK